MITLKHRLSFLQKLLHCQIKNVFEIHLNNIDLFEGLQNVLNIFIKLKETKKNFLFSEERFFVTVNEKELFYIKKVFSENDKNKDILWYIAEENNIKKEIEFGIFEYSKKWVSSMKLENGLLINTGSFVEYQKKCCCFGCGQNKMTKIYGLNEINPSYFISNHEPQIIKCFPGTQKLGVGRFKIYSNNSIGKIEFPFDATFEEKLTIIHYVYNDMIKKRKQSSKNPFL